MSDTISQRCIRCLEETDCIEGLCQECVLELQDDMNFLDEGENEDE